MIEGDRPGAQLHERLAGAHLGTLATGARYIFGFGPDFYGIWDERSSQPPERFPVTPEGRDAAWRRYGELEPSAGREEPPWVRAPGAEVAEPERPWWARRGAWVVAAAVVVIGGVVVATRPGGGVADTDGGGGPVGSEAQVEISGAVTLSNDLTQESFEGSTLQSLVPEVSASWTGVSVELQLSLGQPRIGEFRTGENPPRSLTLVVNGVTITSRRQECTLTLDALSTEGISGSFACAGLPAPAGEGTIDAQGTFAAGT